MRLLRLFLAVVFVVACGPSAPGVEPPAPTRSSVRLMDWQTVDFLTEGLQTSAGLPATPEEVWAVLPEVYEQLGIPVTDRSPGRKTLGNVGFRTRSLGGKRVGEYFDCGRSNSGALANLYDVTFTISTCVTDAPEGGAILSTTLDAWARPRMVNGNPVHCSSKTTLEHRLVELVAEKVGKTMFEIIHEPEVPVLVGVSLGPLPSFDGVLPTWPARRLLTEEEFDAVTPSFPASPSSPGENPKDSGM